MSSTINNLPNSGSDELDEDVGNILSSLQNEYEQNDINDYNQELNLNSNEVSNHAVSNNAISNNAVSNNAVSNNAVSNNAVNNNNNFENTELTDSNESTSFINNLINKCKQPLIVFLVVLVINNNFTHSLFKTIPQINTDGLLNIIGYIIIALMVAISYFTLNIVSEQIL